MKKKRNMSIKAKLLGIIIPVMVAIVVVLVLVAYEMSSGIIGNYSENLLESSVDNQANEIESWLNKNIAGIKSAKKDLQGLILRWVQHTKILREKMSLVHRL